MRFSPDGAHPDIPERRADQAPQRRALPMTTVDEIAASHKKSRRCGAVFSASSNHPTPLRDEVFSAHRPAACAPRGLILPFAPSNQGASPAVKAQIALRPTQCFGNFPRHAGRHFAIVPRRVRAIDSFIMPAFPQCQRCDAAWQKGAVRIGFLPRTAPFFCFVSFSAYRCP